MRRRKGEKFEKFVDQYIKELERLKGKEQRINKVTKNEKSTHYIIEF